MIQRTLLLAVLVLCAQTAMSQSKPTEIDFSVRTVKSGNWSDPKIWKPARVPKQNDRVLITRGHRVVYDVKSEQVIRLLQIVGTLSFARDRDTELNVGVMKVQNSDHCTESGFACDFHGVNDVGEPTALPGGQIPALEVGTPENPIPAKHTARIRLHYLEGMNKDDAPALACCSARMDLHGSPLNPTWVKLGATAKAGEKVVTLSKTPEGWHVGDEVIVTSSKHVDNFRSYRGSKNSQTEERKIVRIDGDKVTLDQPLKYEHTGEGDFRSEIANLSRNVIIESADPKGVRGHTVYHRFSRGSVSYARFAHLGKEGVLGRYSLHFHLVDNTMRGSSVIGASIVDSHNRWVTIHGTNYLLVRDCIGYQSVGHGYFLEDATEINNVLDHNLGVQAYSGKRLPKQVLPFDPNDGAAFWWSNGRNTIVRNVACENDQYGYRYDIQRRSNFNSNLKVQTSAGDLKTVDVRTIPIYRFEDNETHSEGLYGMAFAGTDGVGPDTKHPHVLKNLKIWEVHYALRTQIPTMLIENVTIHHGVYGIYRPWFENHVYKNLSINSTNAEPFNRGLDDRSLQHGSIAVDGLTFDGVRNGSVPLIQISANNASGDAESHFRNVKVLNRSDRMKRALVNLGGGPRLKPRTEKGVPIYIHDWYGKGRHAKVVSTRAKDLLGDGNKYREDEPLTGNESRVAEVKNVKFPKLLDPVDDLPPATIVLSATSTGSRHRVRGISHDNGEIASVSVNGQKAKILSVRAGVVDWEIMLEKPKKGMIYAFATDKAGNAEQTGHHVHVSH